MRYEFELTGHTALLMHADNLDACDELSEWRKDPENKAMSVKGDDRSPAWTWKTYLYTDDKAVVMPSDNIMTCLRSAGAKMLLGGGKGNKTYKEVTQSGMLIEQEFCPLLVPNEPVSVDSINKLLDKPYQDQCDGVEKLGFRLFAKRAKVGQSKHVRVRPRFDKWRIRGSLVVTRNEELTEPIIRKLFDLSGTVGLGDWRPGCKTPGSYGMFKSTVKRA